MILSIGGPFYPDLIRTIASFDLTVFNRLFRVNKFFHQSLEPLLMSYAYSEISAHEATLYLKCTELEPYLDFREPFSLTHPFMESDQIIAKRVSITVHSTSSWMHKYRAALRIDDSEYYSKVQALIQSNHHLHLHQLYCLLMRRTSAVKYLGKQFAKKYLKEVIIRRIHALLKELSPRMIDERSPYLLKDYCEELTIYYQRGNLPWDDEMEIEHAVHPCCSLETSICLLINILLRRLNWILKNVSIPLIYHDDKVQDRIPAILERLEDLKRTGPTMTSQP